MSDRPNRVRLARRPPGAAAPTVAEVPAPASAAPKAPAPVAVVAETPQAVVAAPAKRTPGRRATASPAAVGETLGGRSVQYAARLDGELIAEWRERVQATGRPQSAAVAAAVEAFLALGEDEADRLILDVVQAGAGGAASGPALPYSVRLPEDLLTRWKALVDELARPQAAAVTAALRAFLELEPADFDRQIRRSIKARKDAA